jgi:OFA family oxalate/formate antiporter-like MFS transporter
MSTEKSRNRWFVVVGALMVQLALGSVYAFSIFTDPLSGSLGYSAASFWILGIFATAIAVFAITMVFAGRIQDRIGPKIVATVGGLVYAAGYLMASQFTDSTFMMYVSYGVVGGIGLGLAYVCPLAAAVKWFPDKRGLVSGIAVAGFGAGAFLFTQVGKYIINASDDGLGNSFLYLGLIFLAMVVGGSQLLANPPAGWVPKGYILPTAANGGKTTENYDWSQMVRTRSFVMLWLMFALAATAGLMMIGNVKNVAKYLDPTGASMVVAQFQTIAGILALFNGAGRIGWGTISDRLGRTSTMKLMFLVQAVVLFASAGFCTLKPTNEWVQFMGLTVLASLVGFTFGGNFALFPTTTADFFGTKNLGNNYGLVFTGYGAAGVLGGLIPGVLAVSGNGFEWVFIAVGLASLAAFGIAFATHPPKAVEATVAEPVAS